METGIGEEYEALLQFLYMAPIGLAQISPAGEIAMVNPPCAQLLLPLSKDGDLANLFTVLEDLMPDLRQRVEAFSEPQGMICEALNLQISGGVPGKSGPQFLALTVLKLDANRLMAVINDVTLVVKRERQLRQHEAWFNAFFNGITDYALVALDRQGRVESWNPSIERLAGFAAKNVVGQYFDVFYPAEAISAARLQDLLHEADQNGWSLEEGWRIRFDGTRFWGSTLVAPFKFANQDVRGATANLGLDDNPAYILVIRDISERREANEALRKAATTDYLTGLANRRCFYEAAEMETKRWKRAPRPLSMIMIDADHFKKINDTYGHPSGDAVLRALAQSLNRNFREIDIVARIGGEEFAVLMPDTNQEEALISAQRLCEAVRHEPVIVEGEAIAVTISAGVVAMDAGTVGVDDFLRRADSALYKAKTQGRNQAVGWSVALESVGLSSMSMPGDARFLRAV